MSQRTRVAVALIALLILIGGALALDSLRGPGDGKTGSPGSVPIHLDGQLVGSFSPADLEQLETVSFVEAEQGKSQQGWLLSDVLQLHLELENLDPDARITVISSSRHKSAELTWAEAAEPANNVTFDLSGRGTLKLVSTLGKLDTRDEWVQDVDRIEITSP